MSTQKSSHEKERDEFVLGIYGSCHKPLYLQAFRLCKKYGFDPSFADDALQELYRKLLYKYPAIAAKYEKHGRAYLYKILQRELLSLKRKDKSLKRICDVIGERAPRKAKPGHYSTEEAIVSFLRDIEKLVSEEELDILRYYLEGYAMKEIGEFMATNPSTVGVRIHRLRRRLEPHLPAD